jgi:SAM-dependent methyltransferase
MIAAAMQELPMSDDHGIVDSHFGILRQATTTAERHWERLYATRDISEATWYQGRALRSLAMIEAVAGAPSRILDVGGGASTLVDELFARGWRDLTVLDISATALDIARARLGNEARHVRWIQADITRVGLPHAKFDVWHDRGVFHFLTDAARRAAYVAQLRRAVRPGGHVIIGAYGLDGPRYCSGLPVMRFTPDTLHAELGDAFELVEQVEERHRTPGGATQGFVYCRCVLAGAGAQAHPARLDIGGTMIAAGSACSPRAIAA